MVGTMVAYSIMQNHYTPVKEGLERSLNYHKDREQKLTTDIITMNRILTQFED